MTIKSFIPILAFPFFVFSCGSPEGKTPDSISEEIVDELIAPSSPCELLTVDDVRMTCEVSDEFEINQEDKEYTYPTCTFRWEDGKVQKEMEVAGRKMTIDQPSEVMVVMVVDADEKMYERSIKVYKDGEDVASVGDKAIWGTEMSQLSFLKSGYLFHVHVQTSNDNETNKQQAIDIAVKLMSKI